MPPDPGVVETFATSKDTKAWEKLVDAFLASPRFAERQTLLWLDLVRYAEVKAFPIIPCNLCGSQENLQRKAIKQMMQDWDRRFPGRIETMFTAIQDVIPSHLLDHKLFDFKSINRDSGIIDGGDKAFDPPEMPKAPLLDIDEMDMLDVIEVR
jgi:tRNA 2-thiocytidine biosynthesis protein TtcA